eukprot:2022656-Rhodomonas_salina.4
MIITDDDHHDGSDAPSLTAETVSRRVTRARRPASVSRAGHRDTGNGPGTGTVTVITVKMPPSRIRVIIDSGQRDTRQVP